MTSTSDGPALLRLDTGDEGQRGQHGEVDEQSEPPPTGHGRPAFPRPAGEGRRAGRVGGDGDVVGGGTLHGWDQDDREQEKDDQRPPQEELQSQAAVGVLEDGTGELDHACIFP